MVCFLYLLLDALNNNASTAETTSAAGGNETDLLSGGRVAGNRSGVTDVLMVTSSVGVLNGVHGNTANDGPAVALGLVLVVGATGLEEGLLGTTTTGDQTDHGAAVGSDDLLLTRGELEDGAVHIGVVSDDGGVLSGGACERSAVSRALLYVAHYGTFGQQTDGQDVSDGQLRAATGIDELSGEHTLGGDECLDLLAGRRGVVEYHLRQGRSTSWVVNDGLHQSLHVSVALCVVQDAVLGCSSSVMRVRLEDTSSSLTLSTNDTTHF